MDRRRFIVGAAAVAFTAGCSGNDSDDSDAETDGSGDGTDGMDGGDDDLGAGGTGPSFDPPAEDADPETLLPVANDEWEQTETGPQPEGEAGVYGVYDRADGDGYQIAIIRWESQARASEEVETFESYNAGTYVVIGNFSFIVYGSGSDQYALLDRSPKMTAEYAEANDLLS
jgi:hypothetical protein